MYIKVKVRAGAKKELFECVGENRFYISVKEKAERNMANTRVRELISLEYGVGLNVVKLISGHTSPSKILSIR